MSSAAAPFVSSSAPDRSELAAALQAVKTRLGLVVVLLALAGVAWWSTVDRMAGMDGGPGTDLGALGWFLGVWVVMMAAMMFPSVAPTVALYRTMTRRRSPDLALLFAAGYLLVWAAAGLAAYGVFELGKAVLGDALAWHRAGRPVAAAVLALAAAYELTPLKHVCLVKCRTPLGFLLGSWRDGRLGALRMGAQHGAWCLGCCWALMAALLALGVMSITWMAVVAVLIAVEKLVPWRRVATWSVTAVLVALAIGVVASPQNVPGLVVPGSSGAMHSIATSGSNRSHDVMR